MTAETAISISEKDAHKFEPAMLQKFIDVVKVYPIGNQVILNDNRIGSIKEQTTNPFRPIIELKSESFPQTKSLIKRINLN